jgi:hypothetical protein
MQEVGFVYYLTDGIVKKLYSAKLHHSKNVFEIWLDVVADEIFEMLKGEVRNEIQISG